MQNASRGGRWVREHLVARERDTDGPTPDDAIGGQVGEGEVSPAVAHGCDHCPRALALVEGGRSPTGDRLERLCELGKAEQVARHEPRAVRAAVNPTRLVGVADDRIEHRVDMGLGTRELDSGPGHLDRRREQDAPREAPVGSMRGLEPRDHPRHGHRRGTDQKRLGGLAVTEKDVDCVHLPRPGLFQAKARSRHEEIGEPRGAVVRAMDEHEAAGGGAREEALRDRACERGRDARVDGVPALLEHPRARARAQRVARRRPRPSSPASDDRRVVPHRANTSSFADARLRGRPLDAHGPSLDAARGAYPARNDGVSNGSLNPLPTAASARGRLPPPSPVAITVIQI